MHVLVTVATGFVGGRLVPAVFAPEYDVATLVGDVTPPDEAVARVLGSGR